MFYRIQNDGASMQISPGAQNGVKISHNWVTDSPKKGLRFDGNGHPLGLHGFQAQYTKRILNDIIKTFSKTFAGCIRGSTYIFLKILH